MGLVEIHFGANAAGPPPYFIPPIQFLVDPTPAVHGEFGLGLTSANLDGNSKADLVVGAPGYPVNGIPNTGKLYVHKY